MRDRGNGSITDDWNGGTLNEMGWAHFTIKSHINGAELPLGSCCFTWKHWWAGWTWEGDAFTLGTARRCAGTTQVPLQCHTWAVFLPQPHKPAAVSEWAATGASKAKGKTVLSLAQNAFLFLFFLMLKLQALFLLMTYISPVKLDYYQCLCDSHFGGNLTTCWGSLCLHYGRSETFPWLFIHLSEGKEQKTLAEFSNKTTCCQQSYSFSRIFTEKFTYSIFQHLSASPQLSSFTSWKKNIQDWQEKFLYQNPPAEEEISSFFLLITW